MKKIPLRFRPKGLERALLRVLWNARCHPTVPMLAVYVWLRAVGSSGPYPGATRLGRLLGLGRQAVTRAQARLRDAGLVRFEGRGGACRFTLAEDGGSERDHRDAWAEVHGWMARPRPSRLRGHGSGPSLRDLVPTTKAEVAAARVAEDQEVDRLERMQAEMPSDVRGWFLESPERMDLFLRFGSGACALTEEQCAALGSAASDWLAQDPVLPNMPYRPGFTTVQLAGYYWSRACRWRSFFDVPLEFPRWGRLVRNLRELEVGRTGWQRFLFVYQIVEHLELIWHLAGLSGSKVAPDEDTPISPSITRVCHVIAEHGQLWVDQAYEDMNAGADGLGRGLRADTAA